MKILETIDLRVSTADMEAAREMIQLLINENMDGNDIRISCYRNYDIKTDYTIQIFHNKQNIEITGSRIAEKIIFTLKGFGLINHNIWRKL